MNSNDPTPENGTLYVDAFEIPDFSSDPNMYANISTGNDGWTCDEVVNKITVIKARVFQNGVAMSEIYSNSYMISDEECPYSFPVVSIYSDYANLYDDATGILVPGNAFNPDHITYTGNYFGDWPRPANFEFFTAQFEPIMNIPVILNVHGRASRHSPQKGLRIKPDQLRGEKDFEHNFFTDTERGTFNKLLLKSLTSNLSKTLVNVPLSYELAENSKVDVAYSELEPVITFMNGEYYGIYYLREFIDNDFFEYYLNIDKDSLTYFNGYIGENSLDYGTMEYMDYTLETILPSNPENEDFFELFTGFFNVNNLFDYYLHQIFIANDDWPGNNLNFFRNENNNGKWNAIFWDLDFAMHSHNVVYVEKLIDYVNNYNINDVPIHWQFITIALRNQEMKDAFNVRFNRYMENYCLEKNYEMLDSIQDALMPEWEEYHTRFGNVISNVESWDSAFIQHRYVMELKPEKMRNAMMELMDVIYDGSIDNCMEEEVDTLVNINDFSQIGMLENVLVYNINGQVVGGFDELLRFNEVIDKVELLDLKTGFYVIAGIDKKNDIVSFKYIQTMY